VNTWSRTAGTVAASALTVLTLAACSTSSGSAAGTANGSSTATPSGGASAAQGAQAPQHLDVTGFAVLTMTPGTVVLDVRTPEEFATGHLAGARNVDFRAADFTTRIAALDRATTYAVYCHSGNRSGQALQAMTGTGFTHLADLTGGITAWSAAGKPLTTN
jgi:rhodanese-related sulfurtransferase